MHGKFKAGGEEHDRAFKDWKKKTEKGKQNVRIRRKRETTLKEDGVPCKSLEIRRRNVMMNGSEEKEKEWRGGWRRQWKYDQNGKA